MTAGLHPTSGKEEDLATRLARVYLWISLFLAIPVGRSRDLLGPEALLCGYVVFAALFAAAVWKIGTAKRIAHRVRERSTFLPGVLLLAGPVAVWTDRSWPTS